MEPCRGSAAALSGPVSSPPTSSAGLLCSPEQVAYLHPASRGFDHPGSGRGSARAGCSYVTGEQSAAELPCLACFAALGERRRLKPCSGGSVPRRYRMGCQGNRWQCNSAGGFQSFNLSMKRAVINHFYSYLFSWASAAAGAVLQHQGLLTAVLVPSRQ